MLLTIVFVLFAIVALAALEITLFRQLAERDDRGRSDRQALRRRPGRTGSALHPWTVPTRAGRAKSVVAPRTRRHVSRAVRTREPDRSYRDRYDTCDEPGPRFRLQRWMG